MQAASGTLTAVAQITGVLAGAFEDNKAIAAANIVVSTAAAVMKTLETGGAFAFPLAAAVATAGAVQLASVLSAKPGSASLSGSTGGAAGGSTAAAAQPAQRTVNVTIQGDYLPTERVGGLMQRLQEEAGVDGLQFVLVHKQA